MNQQSRQSCRHYLCAPVLARDARVLPRSPRRRLWGGEDRPRPLRRRAPWGQPRASPVRCRQEAQGSRTGARGAAGGRRGGTCLPCCCQPVLSRLARAREQYDEDGIFTCTLVVTGESVASAASMSDACEAINTIVLRACASLLPTSAELEEAGWGEDQPCTVLGPEPEELVDADGEVVRSP